MRALSSANVLHIFFQSTPPSGQGPGPTDQTPPTPPSTSGVLDSRAPPPASTSTSATTDADVSGAFTKSLNEEIDSILSGRSPSSNTASAMLFGTTDGKDGAVQEDPDDVRFNQKHPGCLDTVDPASQLHGDDARCWYAHCCILKKVNMAKRECFRVPDSIEQWRHVDTLHDVIIHCLFRGTEARDEVDLHDFNQVEEFIAQFIELREGYVARGCQDDCFCKDYVPESWETRSTSSSSSSSSRSPSPPPATSERSEETKKPASAATGVKSVTLLDQAQVLSWCVLPAGYDNASKDVPDSYKMYDTSHNIFGTPGKLFSVREWWNRLTKPVQVNFCTPGKFEKVTLGRYFRTYVESNRDSVIISRQRSFSTNNTSRCFVHVNADHMRKSGTASHAWKTALSRLSGPEFTFFLLTGRLPVDIARDVNEFRATKVGSVVVKDEKALEARWGIYNRVRVGRCTEFIAVHKSKLQIKGQEKAKPGHTPWRKHLAYVSAQAPSASKPAASSGDEMEIDDSAAAAQGTTASSSGSMQPPPAPAPQGRFQSSPPVAADRNAKRRQNAELDAEIKECENRLRVLKANKSRISWTKEERQAQAAEANQKALSLEMRARQHLERFKVSPPRGLEEMYEQCLMLNPKLKGCKRCGSDAVDSHACPVLDEQERPASNTSWFTDPERLNHEVPEFLEDAEEKRCNYSFSP